MKKVDRKYLAHFINTGTYSKPIYERLGSDLMEFSPRLKAKVETSRNILGETVVTISSYEKTAGVELYYAEEGSALFHKLQTIIDNGLVLDDLKTEVIEVKLWDSIQEDTYPATLEEVYIEVLSYGGDTTGYQIPFVLHFTDKKEAGSFCMTDRNFTRAT